MPRDDLMRMKEKIAEYLPPGKFMICPVRNCDEKPMSGKQGTTAWISGDQGQGEKILKFVDRDKARLYCQERDALHRLQQTTEPRVDVLFYQKISLHDSCRLIVMPPQPISLWLLMKNCSEDISSGYFSWCLWKLLNALEYIHSKEIIHRDIKPENILLDGHSGEPVIIDWGFAKNGGDDPYSKRDAADKFLLDNGEDISDEEKTAISSAINELNEAITSRDQKSIESKTQALDDTPHYRVSSQGTALYMALEVFQSYERCVTLTFEAYQTKVDYWPCIIIIAELILYTKVKDTLDSELKDSLNTLYCSWRDNASNIIDQLKGRRTRTAFGEDLFKPLEDAREKFMNGVVKRLGLEGDVTEEMVSNCLVEKMGDRTTWDRSATMKVVHELAFRPEKNESLSFTINKRQQSPLPAGHDPMLLLLYPPPVHQLLFPPSRRVDDPGEACFCVVQ